MWLIAGEISVPLQERSDLLPGRIYKVMQSVLKRVVPACFVLGAAMELFMVKTGFYDIVTRKEAERRVEAILAEEKRQSRLKSLNISFPKE